MSRKLKILFKPAGGMGHINAAIGFAQALSDRGHQCIFFTTTKEVGEFKKYGFDEIFLKLDEDNNKKQESNDKDHPLKSFQADLQFMHDAGIFSPLTSIQKLDAYRKMMDVRVPNSLGLVKHQQLVQMHPQIEKAIAEIEPDLIIADLCHFSLAPCIAYGKIPWVFFHSEGALSLYYSQNVPPPLSGLPSDDQTGWAEFREKFEKLYCESHRYAQNLINKEFGYPEVDEDTFLLTSPYLNVYGCPEELDYHDIGKLPDNYVRIDTYCRKEAKKFELPEDFKAKIQPGDKLIYLSMGSMAAFDYEIMKKFIKVLAKTPHKYIVSKGIFHDQYELADNMWGDAYVSQTNILPIIDMIITHGGNNTVAETLSFGKPMLVFPIFVDQFDNAQRVKEKGFGDRLETFSFTDEELIGKVNKILNDDRMRERCRKAGERIRNSNSKEKACERVEKLFEN